MGRRQTVAHTVNAGRMRLIHGDDRVAGYARGGAEWDDAAGAVKPLGGGRLAGNVGSVCHWSTRGVAGAHRELWERAGKVAGRLDVQRSNASEAQGKKYQRIQGSQQ